MAKTSQSRNESIVGDDVGVLGVKKESKSATKVSKFGEVRDESGGQNGVKMVAIFYEKRVDLVCEQWGEQSER